MSEESEHDYVHDTLHAAFDAEVTGLDIGVVPVGAVLADGAALRIRRRVTAVSGVAALAVLPVAAVAIFAGGAGGGGVVRAGQQPTPHGTNTTANAAEGTPTTPHTPGFSLSVILPQQPLTTEASTPPQSNDKITVVGTGTENGRQWRLVRDEYVVALSGSFPQNLPAATDGPHLPLSRSGTAGTSTCVFIGVQFGTKPPGTTPDFNPTGQCNLHPGPVTGPLSLGPANTPGAPVWVLVGEVADASKMVKASLSGPKVTTAPQPVLTVPGEKDGHYVFFLPPLTDDPNHPLTIKLYDTAGHVVSSTTMNG